VSGHSKWATTKHKKAGIDAKRGKLFAKLIKNVEVAARTGGGDLSGNPTLFDAVQKAKKSSVPNDNIDRAVKRGAGLEAGGVDYQAITYEGYAPGGVAVLIECLTDNRNRSAMEVRTAMTRNGGSMADPGSVSYLFTRKGVVVVPCRTPASTTTPPRPGSCRASASSSTRTARARSSASSTRSRTATTCRTCTRTTTCPTRSWSSSADPFRPRSPHRSLRSRRHPRVPRSAVPLVFL
jgi:hypothetical protein